MGGRDIVHYNIVKEKHLHKAARTVLRSVLLFLIILRVLIKKIYWLFDLFACEERKRYSTLTVGFF
jgi:hypothetical protein